MTDCYARFRQLQGDLAWPSPEILPFEPWLTRLFEDHFHGPGSCMSDHPPPALADEFQEELIWEHIISASGSASVLLDTRETAQTARQAWALCSQWKVPVGQDAYWSAPDPGAFAKWAEGFCTYCDEAKIAHRAGLAGFMAECVKNCGRKYLSDLILAGFDEFSPGIIDLFSALQQTGTKIAHLAMPDKKAFARRIEFADDQTELRAAALWAKSLAEKQPGARIGIISPDLAARRDYVEQVFQDVFYPSVPAISDPPEFRAFNISAAPALSRYPVVAAALQILELACSLKAEIKTWSLLARSPFLAGSLSEYCSRALLDCAMADQGDFVFSVSRTAAFARSLSESEKNVSDPGVFASVLEKIHLLSQNFPKPQNPDQWSRAFSQILDAAGWPGQRSLSSHEFQAVEAFRQALERFAALFCPSGKMSFAEAIQAFNRLVSQIIFQPEHPEVSVQIMGMLEASGQEFDALWIMGMDNEAWPPPARHNPFIPPAVSRSLGLPRSSPERELVRARTITKRLLQSADFVICSHARIDGEAERLASPLISFLEPADIKDLHLQSFCGWQESVRSWIKAGSLEELSDSMGAPVNPGAGVPGGTGVLKSQAACPFQAYARYRLGARAMEMPGPGLDARNRGNLVHHVLELLWNRLKDSDRLLTMDESSLGDIIRESVLTAVKKMSVKMPETFTPGFARLETHRLENLMEEWMENEKKRAPFAVIAAENRMNIRIGKIKLSTFADRIDRLKDGKKILIDYKTGSPAPGDWFTPRIAEPQLPLYSLGIGAENLAGVFFARIKKGQCAYLGIAASDGLAEGVRCVADDRRVAKDAGNMEDVINIWQNQLEMLAEEIASGHAQVCPQSVHKTCRYCDLQAMCRIWEINSRREELLSEAE
jgi:probable DNA repair protein